MATAVIDSVGALVQELHRYQLLAAPQLDELNGPLRSRCPNSRALAQALVERGWVSAFQMNLLLGGRGKSLLLGPYRLLDRIGEGTTGQVFKAHHVAMNRIVALKVIRPEMLSDPEVVQRFYREVRVLSQLAHPHIVHAYDAGEFGATYYLAMEYVEGVDLAQLVKQNGPLGLAQACSYILQAALGLQHAHEKGLVHRDIKPSNLLVARKVAAGNGSPSGSKSGSGSHSSLTMPLSGANLPWGLVKILDLGLARGTRKSGEQSMAGVTLAGKGMMGTPDYLAPEQALDLHTADIRADLYSLGCTFYFLLTGQPPFANCPLAQKLMKHQMAEPPALAKFRTDVPKSVQSVLWRLLAKKPEDRFQTPAALVEQLGAAMGGIIPAAALATAQADRTVVLGRSRTPTKGLARWKTGRWKTPTLRLPKRSRRLWLLLSGAGALLLFGLFAVSAGLLMRFGSALTGAGTAPAPVTVREEPGTAAFRPLALRHQRFTEHAGEEPEPLRVALLAYQREHPGSAQSLRAAQMLKDLPSPLDRLSEKNIPPLQRRPWQPREIVAVLGEHRGRSWDTMSSLAVSPDGKVIAGGTADGMVHVFETDTLIDRPPLKATSGHVFGVALADNQTVAAACQDYKVRIWSLAEPEKAPVALQHPAAYVNGLAFAPGGKLLASANADSKVHIWENAAAGWKERPPLAGHTDWAHRVAFSADGKTLAAGCGDGSIRLWNVAAESITEREVLKGHAGAIHALCYSPDGKLLLSGGYDKTVRLWDVSANPARPVFVHKDQGRIVAASLSADGKMMAFTGAYTGFVELWSVADPMAPRQLGVMRIHGTSTSALTFAPDGKTLITTGGDRRVRLWDIGLAGVKERVLLPLPEAGLGGGAGLSVSPDGSTVAIHGRLDPTVQFWSLADVPSERFRASGYPGSVNPMAFGPDGKSFALSRYSNLFFFPLTEVNPKVTSLQPLHTARVAALAFAPDGKTLATAGSADQTVRLWDVTRPEPKERAVWKLKEAGNQVLSLAYTPDGKNLGVLGSDRKVRVLDMSTADFGAREQVLDELSDQPAAVGFSPDGKLLAVLGGKDGRAALWDWTKPRPQLQQTIGGTNPNGTTAVHSLAFSPDGKMVATTMTGPEPVTIWDMATGKKLRSWQLPGPASTVDFAPDSRHLFVANGNGTVYLLRLGPPAAVGKK